MAINYRVSRQLKVALTKAAAMSDEEQDEIAAMILQKLAGDDFTAPGKSSFLAPHVSVMRDFLDLILPKHSGARILTLLFLSFVLFVQAPMALIATLAMTVHELTARPSGAARYSRVSVGDASHRVVHVPESEPVEDEPGSAP